MERLLTGQFNAYGSHQGSMKESQYHKDKITKLLAECTNLNESNMKYKESYIKLKQQAKTMEVKLAKQSNKIKYLLSNGQFMQYPSLIEASISPRLFDQQSVGHKHISVHEHYDSQLGETTGDFELGGSEGSLGRMENFDQNSLAEFS